MAENKTRDAGAGADGAEQVLFVRASCPFCQKVLRHLAARAISVAQRDIGEDPKARADLIAVGGRGQVPCLVTGAEAMYESDAIIAYFDRQAERT